MKPESRSSRTRLLAAVTGFALVCALTVLVFLIRAGDEGAANWPVNWDLRSSDNGVLFQLVQDVAAGRSLDWSFSPQVYVFPELPISVLAFLLAGGSVYGYYLVVAAINAGLLFLGLFGLSGLLYPREPAGTRLARALLASVPLLLFPLLSPSWLASFHLAPTYYFGMYLMVVAAPGVFLARTKWMRVLIACGIVLAAASNPLGLVFAVPSFAVVILVQALRFGWRSVIRPAVVTAAILSAALVVRLVLFSPIQGTSPLTYVDPEVFAGRLSALLPYFDFITNDPATAAIVVAGATLALGCLAGAGIVAFRFVRRARQHDTAGPLAGGTNSLAAVYFGLVPLAGLAATFALLITHYLYFWLVLVAPFVFVLLFLPTRIATRLLPVAVTGLVVAALFAGAVENLAHPERYFGYRNPETTCIDEALPGDRMIGYSTFSDARRLSLTSESGFRLIQVRSSGEPSYWLTNRSYLREEAGSFFYVNGRGDEPAIDTAFLLEEFGQPDSIAQCGEGQSVLLYTNPIALEAIATYYQRD